MRKTAFAYTTFVVDFDNYEEAKLFILDSVKNRSGERRFVSNVGNERMYHIPEEKIDLFIYHYVDKYGTFDFMGEEVNEYWSITFEQKYKNCNMG